MDDYYVECQSNLKNTQNFIAAIDNLVSINVQDLPKVQLSKSVEQTITLLSVTFQVTNCPPQDLIAKFQQLRKQLEATLDYMEQIIVAETEFPPTYQPDSCWW